MTDFLNKNSVLVLNSYCQAIGTLSPKKALIALNSTSDHFMSVAKAVDVLYDKDTDGKWILPPVGSALNFQPYSFEEWLMVDFREGIDSWVHTSKTKIRVPTVIMTNYSGIPKRRLRPTKTMLYKMQGGKCGYSGKHIPFKKGNIEHKRAKSHGGRDTFENLMFVDEEINSARGNKPLKDMGLKPLFNHKTPAPIPVAFTIENVGHVDWLYFLNK